MESTTTSQILQNDILPYLINFSHKANKLNIEQFTGIVTEFIKELGASSLVSILFHGLYNIKNDNKPKWISFLHQQISSQTQDVAWV